uniref:Uncharacterized protein n=1 Tax=viral metagenome TaxID=1070528 RepID=A0A6M3KUJ3_9ZZZZ
MAQDIPDENFSKSYIFDKKLDRTTPSLLLPEGSIVEGLNIGRPHSVPVGWERRGGTTRFNTTPIASAQVKGVFQCINPEHDIQAFYAQCNDNVYTGNTVPPSTTSSFGSLIYSLDSGTSPLFGMKINDDMVWAGTGNTPFAHSGSSAYPDAFYVKHETGNTIYVDGYDKVRNNRSDTNILLPQHSGASEFAYIGFRRRLSGFSIDLVPGVTNTMASGLTIAALRNGSFIGVSNLKDGTASPSGVTTLYENLGHISWDASTEDDPYLLPGTKDHMYWYRAGVTADVTNGILAYQIKVNDRCEDITNLWSKLYWLASGCLKSTVTGFVDYSGEVTDGTDAEYAELDNLATTQALYIGFTNKTFGLNVKLVPGETNVQTQGHVRIYYWNGGNNNWTEITGTTNDGTSSNGYPLTQSGVIQWDGQSIQEDERTLGGFVLPLYWYKLQWSITMPASVQVWEVAQLEKPDTIPPFPDYDFVVEYNGRAVWGPGHEFKMGLDFSQEGYPHVMNGPKAGSTGNIFPGIPTCMAHLHSYALVGGIDFVAMMEGKVPGRFDEYRVTNNVGVVAPHTLLIIDDGIKIFSQTKQVNAGIFMSHDGIYMAEMVAVKVSQPIADYWDTGSTPYIEPEYMDDSYAWINYQTKCVHFAVPMNVNNSSTKQTTLNYEIVYNYVLDEFYDLHKRANPASCGAAIIGKDNQKMAYIGDYSGTVYRTNTGNSDNNTIIEHYLKTSDIMTLAGIKPDPLNYSTLLNAVKVKAKAQAVGNIEVLFYPDGAESGSTPTGSGGNTISMINSGSGYAQGKLKTGQGGILAETHAMRFRSGVSTAELNTNMQIYGFTIDARPERATGGP